MTGDQRPAVRGRQISNRTRLSWNLGRAGPKSRAGSGWGHKDSEAAPRTCPSVCFNTSNSQI